MTAPTTEVVEQTPRGRQRASTPRRLRAISPWRRRSEEGEESPTKRESRSVSRGRRSSCRGRPELERRPSLRQSARSLLQRASSFGSLVRSASSRSLKGDEEGDDDDDDDENQDAREWKALSRQLNQHYTKLKKRAAALEKQYHAHKRQAMAHYATRRKSEQAAAYQAMRQADKYKTQRAHVTVALTGLADLRQQVQDAIQYECYTTSPTMKRQKMGGILANLEYNAQQYTQLTDKQARKELKASFQQENWKESLKHIDVKK